MVGIDRIVELAQTALQSSNFLWAAKPLDYAMFTDS